MGLQRQTTPVLSGDNTPHNLDVMVMGFLIGRRLSLASSYDTTLPTAFFVN